MKNPSTPAAVLLVAVLLSGHGAMAQTGVAGAGPGEAISAEQVHAEGIELLHKHQVDAAVQRFIQAVSMDRESALYVTDLGFAYLRQRRFTDAEAAFRKAIQLDPARPHAYEHLVQSITQQSERWQKRQELLTTLEQGILISREQPARFRIELARIEAERSFGLMERAQEHIRALLLEKAIPRLLEKRANDLKTELEWQRRARALEDWPEPTVATADQEQLRHSEQTKTAVDRKRTLTVLSELLDRYPAWRAPRRLRATIFAENGHYDEAVKDLTVLTRLAPTEPDYHRQLGILLAEHGGLLELEHADEALRTALAFEPEWIELDQVRQRLAARRYAPRVSPTAWSRQQPPSENALRLYREAEGILEQDEPDQAAALELLDQALKESPAYVEAAVLSYSLSKRVPEGTLRALWNDGKGLFSFYQELSRLDPAPDRSVLDPWLDRAIQLGVVAARLSRALNRKTQGDRAGAELELSNYLALVTDREEIASVQLLRAELTPKAQTVDVEGDAIRNAHLRIRNDDAEGALKALEAPCGPSMQAERLLTLGMIYERLNRNAMALDCYELQLAKGEALDRAQKVGRRAARLLARAEPALFEHPAAKRLSQLSSFEPAAYWALARRAVAAGNQAAADQLASSYLAHANPEDRFVPEAVALQRHLHARAQLQRESAQRTRRTLMILVTTTIGLFLSVGYILLFRGSSARRAVRKHPSFFPHLARIVGEIRHDVLKHRTSVLELLEHDRLSLDKVRDTILKPIPTSEAVVNAYSRLVETAEARRIFLRRLPSEPVFGSLVRDLQRLERALVRDAPTKKLLRFDERLRNLHWRRLEELIALGPSCDLDAAVLQHWIASIQAEIEGKRLEWTPPALELSEPQFCFPIDAASLFQIFANLVRNAQIAVSCEPRPQLRVALHRATDFTGKSAVQLLIADNATTTLTDAMVEAQSTGRGLGIVRDITRDWHGQLLIRDEPTPYRKSIGVQFMK